MHVFISPITSPITQRAAQGDAKWCSPWSETYFEQIHAWFCDEGLPFETSTHIVHALLYLYGLTDGERDEYMKIYVRELQMAVTSKETKILNYTRKTGMLEFFLNDEFRTTFLPMVIIKYKGIHRVLEEVRYSELFSRYTDTVKQNLIHNIDEQQLQQMNIKHESVSAICDKIIKFCK